MYSEKKTREKLVHAVSAYSYQGLEKKIVFFFFNLLELASSEFSLVFFFFSSFLFHMATEKRVHVCNGEDEEQDDQKMEKFFALIKNFQEARNRRNDELRQRVLETENW